MGAAATAAVVSTDTRRSIISPGANYILPLLAPVVFVSMFEPSSDDHGGNEQNGCLNFK